MPPWPRWTSRPIASGACTWPHVPWSLKPVAPGSTRFWHRGAASRPRSRLRDRISTRPLAVDDRRPSPFPIHTNWNINMSELIAQLNWRYATKKFNPSKIVAHDAVERILEAIRLTATSSDLQPFEVFVITNLGIREKIKAIGWNQEQITDCSHLLVFAAWDDITADRVNLVFDLTNEVRGETSEAWENYRHQLLGMVAQRSQEENYQS